MECFKCLQKVDEPNSRYMCIGAITQLLTGYICKNCALGDWKSAIPPDTIVEKLHELTPEHKDLLAKIETECPKWQILNQKNGIATVTWQESPGVSRVRQFRLPDKLCTCCSGAE